MTDRDLARKLRAEARAPYRPLRKFIYGALGGIGFDWGGDIFIPADRGQGGLARGRF